MTELRYAALTLPLMNIEKDFHSLTKKESDKEMITKREKGTCSVDNWSFNIFHMMKRNLLLDLIEVLKQTL